MKKIIIILGATAVGKTFFSIKLAQMLDCEIVSADSMQVYKYLDIGSAKPTKEEMNLVKHYLVDNIDPSDNFSVAEYQKLAKKSINEIFEKNKIPLITGGTGLYINSLIYNMDFSLPPMDKKYRKELENIKNEKGSKYLHDLLREKDLELADRIHPNNWQKIIRALEVVSNSDKTIEPFYKSKVNTEDYEVLLIGLNRDRTELYERINARVDILIKNGLFLEVEGLLKNGLKESDISMKGIGYKEVISYLDGKISKDETIDLIKKNTRRYAKRQLTWFRKYDNIKWFELTDNDEYILEDIYKWIKNKI